MRTRLIVAVLMLTGIGAGTWVLVVSGDWARGSDHAGTVSAPSSGRWVGVGSGLGVRPPAGWHVITARLTRVLSPVQRLVVTSFALRQVRPNPGCAPTSAIRQLPLTGAFLFMFEYTGLTRLTHHDLLRFGKRPARFRLSPSTYEPYECMGLSYVILFRDAGRAFQVHVYLGAHATARTRTKLLSVLDTLKVAPKRSDDRPGLLPIPPDGSGDEREHRPSE